MPLWTAPEPVLIQPVSKTSYPGDSREQRGRWVGVAEHCGDALTYLVLTDDTRRVVPRSVLRSALDTLNPNFRAVAPNVDFDPITPSVVPSSPVNLFVQLS